MSQSSGAQGPDKRNAARPRSRIDALVTRLGLGGVVLLFAALWFLRHLIADASTQEILAFGGLALGLTFVLTAVMIGTVILPSFAERAGDIVDVLRGMGQGDLTREPAVVARDPEGERIATAVRTAIAGLRSSIDPVRSAARDVSGRSQDVAIQCTAAVSAAQRSSESLHSLARQGSSIVELAQTAHDDAAKVVRGSALVLEQARAQRLREARLQELSRESLATLQSGMASLETLARDVGGGVQELSALAEASEEIRSFVTLVRKMARQSKLLALNAAMEAARAGEHGSGFAVVASEVRRLARSSSEAADRTDQLVSDVLERLERVRLTAAQAAETVRMVRETSSAGFGMLENLGREADRVLAGTAAEPEDAAGLIGAGEALELRLDHLRRETASLAEGLREAATAAGAQQSRVHELMAAANALTRAAERTTTSLSVLRTERGAVPSPVSPSPAAAPVPELAAESA